MAATPPMVDAAVQRLRCLLRARPEVAASAPSEGSSEAPQAAQRFSVFCRFKAGPVQEGGWELTEKSVTGAAQTFSFDRVFGPGASQASVYEAVEHVVKGVPGGQSGAILCYGQTSAGKTFTMEGPEVDFGEEWQGVIPRALASIFQEVSSMQDPPAVHLSMLEIYMERLRDLLIEPSANGASEATLSIVTNKAGLVRVQGLTPVKVSDLKTAMNIFHYGQSHRMVGATNMNSRSSRSHCLFMVYVEKPGGVPSKLCLADLAGSENLKKAHFREEKDANALMNKEAKDINTSLATLSSVIQRLARCKHGKEEHIPYRDSKLTRLLQDVISGLCKSALIINCAGAREHFTETMSSVRFGACAQRITSHVPTVVTQESKMSVLLRVLNDGCDEIERMRVREQARQLKDKVEECASSTPRCMKDREKDIPTTAPATASCTKIFYTRSHSPPLSFSSSSCSPPSRSPRCESLSRARYDAALQRKVPPKPATWESPNLTRSPGSRDPRMLSPITMSPSRSEMPSPKRALTETPATPVSPRASNRASSFVPTPRIWERPIPTGLDLGIPIFEPSGKGWDWPLSQQELERRGLTRAMASPAQQEREWQSYLQGGIPVVEEEPRAPPVPTSISPHHPERHLVFTSSSRACILPALEAAAAESEPLLPAGETESLQLQPAPLQPAPLRPRDMGSGRQTQLLRLAAGPQARAALRGVWSAWRGRALLVRRQEAVAARLSRELDNSQPRQSGLLLMLLLQAWFATVSWPERAASAALERSSAKRWLLHSAWSAWLCRWLTSQLEEARVVCRLVPDPNDAWLGRNGLLLLSLYIRAWSASLRPEVPSQPSRPEDLVDLDSLLCCEGQEILAWSAEPLADTACSAEICPLVDKKRGEDGHSGFELLSTVGAHPGKSQGNSLALCRSTVNGAPEAYPWNAQRAAGSGALVQAMVSCGTGCCRMLQFVVLAWGAAAIVAELIWLCGPEPDPFF